ncbi:hypothetical protein BLNAU_14553 [Blattamonas nauphoetae]|uniref:Uncharacterized protein n=1 Tax=Blattamonas nauphoetae TaxID=2049346 RepID=A0ABQ9XIA2_9EUKA|nr:hypothetical protein BLNAU_14553 [Blattamonas nauphoetae]
MIMFTLLLTTAPFGDCHSVRELYRSVDQRNSRQDNSSDLIITNGCKSLEWLNIPTGFILFSYSIMSQMNQRAFGLCWQTFVEVHQRSTRRKCPQSNKALVVSLRILRNTKFSKPLVHQRLDLQLRSDIVYSKPNFTRVDKKTHHECLNLLCLVFYNQGDDSDVVSPGDAAIIHRKSLRREID